MVLVLLVEANGFGLLGCCPMDVPIEPQTSPLPLYPPVVPQWLVLLSCCDAHEYARCPCALRGWFWSWKTTGGQNQVARGYLDRLHSLGDIFSRFQDVVLGMSIDGFAILQLGYCAALKLICVKIC